MLDKKLIEEFYKNLISDGDIKKSLIESMNKHKDLSEQQRKRKILEDVILPKSVEYGYNFKIEDLEEYEENLNKSDEYNELSLDDLENISGGLKSGPVAFGLAGLMAISSFFSMGSVLSSKAYNAVSHQNDVQSVASIRVKSDSMDEEASYKEMREVFSNKEDTEENQNEQNFVNVKSNLMEKDESEEGKNASKDFD